MINSFIHLGRQRRYWAALILLGILLEAAALYYQYLLDEWPCVLCIQIRIWILGFIVIGLIAIFCKRLPAVLHTAHLLNTVVMVGFVERSWRVLAVERGWIFGDCDMDLGLPPWFALDSWFPFLFEVQTACGYTPIIILKISMAEVLMVVSSILLLTSVTLLTGNWFNRQ